MACLVFLILNGRNMNQFRVALLVSLFTATGVSMADSEGKLDSTSSSTSRVSLTKLQNVQVAGVSDIVFRNDAPLESNVALSTTMCVYNSAASISITITSSNDTFKISNARNNIPYTVTWDGIPVNNGSAVKGMMGTPITNCSSDDKATLAVIFEQADFNEAPAGTYSDVLTIAVAPE